MTPDPNEPAPDARIADLVRALAASQAEKEETETYCAREVSRAYEVLGRTCNVYGEGLLEILADELGGTLIPMDAEEAQRAVDAVRGLKQALAASQAEAVELRAALEQQAYYATHRKNCDFVLDGGGRRACCDCGYGQADNAVRTALSRPTSTAALDAALAQARAEEREACAQAVEPAISDGEFIEDDFERGLVRGLSTAATRIRKRGEG